jgi:hypothetical protein
MLTTSTVTAVNAERHKTQFWKAPSNYAFTSGSHLTGVSAQEVVHVARALPMGIVKSGDELVLVALLGFRPNQNLFVAPDGRWLASYIPAAFRGYPFRLAQTEGDPTKLTLAVDEASMLVGTDTEGATPFFVDREPHPKTKQMLDFLLKVRQGALLAQRAVSVLAPVIEPWPITVQQGSETQAVNGVYRISESKLNSLTAEEFLPMRSALPIAYAQLFSMQNLPLLERLATFHEAHRSKKVQEEAKLFTPGMEDEKFDWKALFKDE